MTCPRLSKVLRDAQDKYERKRAQYGESWKVLPIGALQVRLTEEFSEYQEASPENKYDELLDVINCAAMLAARNKASKEGQP